HVDAGADAIGGGVDDAHRRGAITADVDLATVWRHHEPVRSLGDRDGGENLVLAGVEDSHRIVLEEPHIGLGRSGGHGRAAACPDRAPTHHDHYPQHLGHAL